MAVATCPPLDQLLAGLSGVPAKGDIEELALHLEQCEECQARVERLNPMSTRVNDQLAHVGQAHSLVMETDFHAAMARLLTTDSTQTADHHFAGQMIDEYRLEESLGAGGMGAVWKARHTRLEMTVAIKFMAHRLSGDPAAEERFAREMRAVGRLQHPNIIRAHDAGESQGQPYLVMEYVSGSDLHQLVKEHGPLSVANACEAVRQVALGLHHAHDAGLVHRDVKPSNLLLTKDGIVKVLDLGLARLGDDEPVYAVANGDGSTRNSELTGASRVLGTRDYMAPEQYRNSRGVDARADVYALGCTLIYLLTGRPPRPGDEAAVIAQGVSVSLLRGCLATDPNERFASAAALATALIPLARGSDLRRATSPAVRPSRFRARYLLAASAVASTLAIGLAIYFSFMPLTSTANADGPATAEEHSTLMLAKLPMTSAEAKSLQSQVAASLDHPATSTNSLGMTMVFIPPGEYGLTTECRATVSRPFLISSKETTVGQFRRFVEAAGFVTDVERNGKGGWRMDRRDYHNMQQQNPKFIWHTPGYDDVTDDHPVTQVSHTDAIAFCEWLSQKDGVTYRLPTEVEWRWACRAGAVTEFYFGSDKSQLRDHAWYLNNAFDQPQTVGQLRPNAWGLFDMLGNVEEWCQDWHAELPTAAVVDYHGAETGKARVLVGGSHIQTQFDCNSRHVGGARTGYAFAGFRIVRDVSINAP